MSRLHTVNSAHAPEEDLEDCRTDPFFATTQPAAQANMVAYQDKLRRTTGRDYV